MELTILMPCLNEEKTIALCIAEAQPQGAFHCAYARGAQAGCPGRPSHLRTVGDGLRHVWFILREG